MSYLPASPPVEYDPAYLMRELTRISDEIDDRVWKKTHAYIEADYVAINEPFIFADASNTAITIDLQTPKGERMFNIKKVDSTSNFVTIDAGSGKTIDGSQTIDIVNQYDSITVYYDNSDWHIV